MPYSGGPSQGNLELSAVRRKLSHSLSLSLVERVQLVFVYRWQGKGWGVGGIPWGLTSSAPAQ